MDDDVPRPVGSRIHSEGNVRGVVAPVAVEHEYPKSPPCSLALRPAKISSVQIVDPFSARSSVRNIRVAIAKVLNVDVRIYWKRDGLGHLLSCYLLIGSDGV